MMNVWKLTDNLDKTEGRGPTVVKGIFSTEEAAHDANRDVEGTMGNPPQYAGDIWRVELNTMPMVEEKVFGYRKDWVGRWGHGWLDLRDQPDKDPEWDEYQRLRRKFGAEEGSLP
jgi:hypothetical protein